MPQSLLLSTIETPKKYWSMKYELHLRMNWSGIVIIQLPTRKYLAHTIAFRLVQNQQEQTRKNSNFNIFKCCKEIRVFPHL